MVKVGCVVYPEPPPVTVTIPTDPRVVIPTVAAAPTPLPLGS